MKKIPSLFQRNYDGDRTLRDEVVSGCFWVLAGEGIATRKMDGTACMVKDGILYKRYNAKNGKTPPAGFIQAEDPNPETGHWHVWIEVGDRPENKLHMEGFDFNPGLKNGTYELCGPKINKNPEKFNRHLLIPHGHEHYFDVPFTFDGIKEWLKDKDIEGIVWHHQDGRMVKIKKRDFWGKR